MATDGKQGDPFKMTTVALVIIAVVMALVFSTQAMSRKKAEKERMAAAREEVMAVDFFLDEGDVPNAIVALHDISLRLAPVEGAEDAAMKVSEAVKAEIAAHEDTKSRLGVAQAEVESLKTQLAEMQRLRDRNMNRTVVLETVRDRNALILGNLVSGQLGLARRLLESTPEKDVVAEAADRLLGHIEALNAAAGAAGAERVHGLRALARLWSVPGIERFAEVVAAEETRRQSIEADLGELSDRLADGDAESARESLKRVLRTAGVAEAESLGERLRTLEVRRAAEAAEERGELAMAAAGYRIVGDEERARRASTRVFGELLVALGRTAVLEQRLLSGAELILAAHQATGDPKLRAESYGLFGQGWLERAREHLNQGRFEAAIDATDVAALFAPEEAGDFMKQVRAEWTRFQAADAAARAREVLDAGAPELAAAFIRKHEVPQELRTDIEIGRREMVRREARLALQSGDAAQALSLLSSIGDEGPLFARASLLAGDVEKGLTGLPRGAEARAVLLLDAAWTVIDADAARAARLGLAALTATGTRPATVALLEAALKRAGEVPKGDKLWDEVKAVIFAANTSLPGEK